MNQTNDAQSNAAEGAVVNLTKESVLHLSKEIETANNNIMVFRTRIGFGMLVGPFLLLGSLIVGAMGQPISFNLTWYGWLALVVIPICYLGLAYIGSEIEAGRGSKTTNGGNSSEGYTKIRMRRSTKKRSRQIAIGVEPGTSWVIRFCFCPCSRLFVLLRMREHLKRKTHR